MLHILTDELKRYVRDFTVSYGKANIALFQMDTIG